VAKPTEVSEQTFDEVVLKSDKPVFVDFWAPWCGPCRIVEPIVEELANEYDGKVGFTKLNVDEAPGIAVRYNIFSIPALLIFKDGQPVDQLVGARPKQDLKEHIDRALGTG
jgi:thioredoxin 1